MGRSTKKGPYIDQKLLKKVRALDRIDTVVFDMDGTLIDSRYDWAAIRGGLGLTGPSIIDELNGPSRMTVVWDGIVARGYSEDDVEKIMGLNQYRLYQEVIG